MKFAYKYGGVYEYILSVVKNRLSVKNTYTFFYTASTPSMDRG